MTALQHRKDFDAVGAAPWSVHLSANLSFENPSSLPANHEGKTMKLSSPKRGTRVVPADGRLLSEKVSAIIYPLPVKQTAESANRTPEAVKKWRTGSTCPDLASAINLARDIPAIKWLLYDEIEGDAPDGVFSQRVVVKALGLLQQIADSDGEHAIAAREILGCGGSK